MSYAQWRHSLARNLDTAFLTTRAVLPGMQLQGWGRVVMVASVTGPVMAMRGEAAYAAAKAGMVGMSKALAAEVASRGITVNCVAPGFIATAMTDALTGDQRTAILGQVPTGRMGEPGEIAAAVLYLASVEAAYVTGATLHVNGGMAMI